MGQHLIDTALLRCLRARQFLPSGRLNIDEPQVQHSVLLVDDDETHRGVVRSWADEMGFRTREAESVEHALDVLDDEPSEIAVCDVNMPGRSGVFSHRSKPE